METSDIWSRFEMPDHHVLQWRAGTVKLTIRRDDTDWFVSTSTSESPELTPFVRCERASDNELDDAKRIAFGAPFDAVEIRPAMPDRPFVLKTDVETRVPDGLRASLYLSLPVFIHFRAFPAAGERERPRDGPHVASTLLSDTWFGTLFAGQLAYALKTPAVHHVANLPPSPLRSITRVTIFNNAEEPLPFSQFCLETHNLGIYEANNRLWTNDVFINHSDPTEPARIRYGARAPKTIQEPGLLCPPANRLSSSLLARTFSFV